MSDRFETWVRAAAEQAAAGEQANENLGWLLGDRFDWSDAWAQARAAFAHLVEAFAETRPLVLQLNVWLTPVPGLDTTIPAADAIPGLIDPTNEPPALTVYRPRVRRLWEPAEVHQRPLPEPLLVGADGEPLAQGLLVLTRDEWCDDTDPFDRELVFERVQ